MDIFIEQLVKKKRTMSDIVKTTAILLISILIPFTCIIFAINLQQAYLLYIAFFAIIALIYIDWYLITSQNVEFEYSVTNSNITIDKIIAKRKRKKMMDIEIRDFENLCKASALNDKSYKKYIFAAEDINSDDTYAATYRSQAFGDCVIIFTPNKKVLDAMRPYLKRQIVIELFVRNK